MYEVCSRYEAMTRKSTHMWYYITYKSNKSDTLLCKSIESKKIYPQVDDSEPVAT